MSDSRNFYSDLPIYELTPVEVLRDPNHFDTVPADWHVVLTDIKGSTANVRGGNQQQINLIATGTVIAALNIAARNGLEIPFFFGGDGATLIVPALIHGEVMDALFEHRQNTLSNFGFELRVGSVNVGDLYDAGQVLGISKAARNPAFSVPVIVGNGLGFAEDRIKSADEEPATAHTSEKVLDLAGMECRWDTVLPPGDSEEIVCLLVVSNADDAMLENFEAVLNLVEEIYGSREKRNPISSDKLALKLGLGRIASEMRCKTGGFDWAYLLENWLRTLIGPGYFRFTDAGRAYVESLPDLADTLVLDGRINTVISGSGKQRAQLLSNLDALEKEGLVTFGFNVSRASVMSCYVRDRHDQHIHFVDGENGGYTKASIMLKNKLKLAP
jgi:hypothetical protein